MGQTRNIHNLIVLGRGYAIAGRRVSSNTLTFFNFVKKNQKNHVFAKEKNHPFACTSSAAVHYRVLFFSCRTRVSHTRSHCRTTGSNRVAKDIVCRFTQWNGLRCRRRLSSRVCKLNRIINNNNNNWARPMREGK